jgi:uroporphyrin-3 C-methyltransferase
MLLDEAQMLLALGGERFVLFRDPAATIAAYRLADSTMAALEDPAFSTVRQSISAEIDALAGLAGVDMGATAAALSAVRASAAGFPAARPDRAAADTTQESHWWRVFGSFVRVRTAADSAVLAQRHDLTLARQLFVLDLRDAEAALLARDPLRYAAALAEAEAALKLDFAADSDSVKAAQAALDRLAKAELAPAPPALLGAALKELRNLRATHAQAQPSRAPVAKQPEGQQ